MMIPVRMRSISRMRRRENFIEGFGVISILKASTADRLSLGPRGRLATMIAVPNSIIARTVERS
jgi:hypothetical protein